MTLSVGTPRVEKPAKPQPVCRLTAAVGPPHRDTESLPGGKPIEVGATQAKNSA